MSTLPRPRLPAARTTTIGWLSKASELATAHQATLWVLAVVALVLDIVTTTYGLQVGLAEMNPVVNYLLPMLGLAGTFTLLKGLAMLVGLLAWWAMPKPHRGIVPLGLVLLWGVAVTSNSLLLADVLL
ncbi:DUF5658 family protein [Halogranum gelatinilyticum]|uniref:DUF5658 family protein n=1 Tax=Halogranum gelatinilyticum TaxID=660521 RepID=UPI0011140F4B|nr:DUF5658 family protein [Halogranum gelatinilyticum]